jgi:zinc protease
MLKKIIFTLAAVLIFVQTGFASAYKTERTVLPNGMTVLVTEMPQSETTAVYALVKAGSATEGEFAGAGITHFVEHMVFKGTTKRSEGDIAAEIQAVGGKVNASTDKDHTLFTITVPSESFDIALDVLSDMLLDPIMREFETEREVILNEMKMHDDNPDRRLNKLTFLDVYHSHPYRHPVIGYPELFKQISNADLFDYYRKFYIPNNIIFSVAGPVDSEAIVQKVSEAFRDFKRGEPVDRNLVQEARPITPRSYEHFYPTDFARLTVSFLGVRLLDEDCYALDVLAQVLGQGASSRLYESLYKQKKLVYSVSAWNYTPVDRGVFAIDATLEDANIEKTLEEIERKISDIQVNGVDQTELEIAKKEVARSRIFAIQTPSAVAAQQAFDESMARDHDFSEKYVQMIGKVTSEDVKRVARVYLAPDKKIVSALRPQTAMEEKKTDQTPVKIETNRYSLKDGTAVLIREDHTLPIVNLRIIYYGGTRMEPEGKTGLSQVTANLLTRGTKLHTAREWNEQTARYGLQFSAFSGHNTLGITLDCLSSDLDKGWVFTKALLYQPAFAEEELTSVKESMLAAIRQRKDSAFQTAQLELREQLFAGHPFRHDQLGTPETLAEIGTGDVRAFFEKMKRTRRPVIAVYGDVVPGKVLAELEKLFVRSGNVDHLEIPVFEPSAPDQPCVKTERLDKEQAVVSFGYKGGTLYSENRYAIELLAEVIGSSFNGRLFQTIREQAGMAYAVGAEYLPTLETGFFSLFALIAPENLTEVTVKINDEIVRVLEQGVTTEELAPFKRYLKGIHMMSRERSGDRATQDALNELYGLGYAWDDDYGQKIDQVTPEEIQRAAETIFKKGGSCQVNVLPKENK